MTTVFLCLRATAMSYLMLLGNIMLPAIYGETYVNFRFKSLDLRKPNVKSLCRDCESWFAELLLPALWHRKMWCLQANAVTMHPPQAPAYSSTTKCHFLLRQTTLVEYPLIIVTSLMYKAAKSECFWSLLLTAANFPSLLEDFLCFATVSLFAFSDMGVQDTQGVI